MNSKATRSRSDGFPPIPGREPFAGVGEPHDDRRHQDDLGHRLEVARGDQRLKAEAARDGDREQHDHREARVHRADDEVGRKDRLAPAGHQARGEIEPDDRVNRADERRRERGEGQLKPSVVAPMTGRAAPAERKDAVDLLPSSARPVARGREVRQDADVPEDDREQEVAGDRPEIPDQRAAPLRPDLHRGRVGREPVEIERPAEMEDREEAGDRDGEQGHRLGEAADRGAPRLARQQQQR